MISRFRVKAQTIHGIDVNDPLAQAAEIAKMVGATSFSVDILAGTITFAIDAIDGGEPQTYTACAGQVVSISAGIVSIQLRTIFYDTFEADVSGI